MLKLLLVSPDKKSLSNLASALDKHDDVELCRAESGESALGIVENIAIDLVVTDETLGDMTGLEFAEKLLLLNPMVNCATISGLASEKFHEISEGLGLMAQLPVQPGINDAERLLRDLRHVKGLLGSV